MGVPTTTILAKKGGVGKTELTQSIAGVFAHQGLRVLAIDCDSQGSLSKNLLGTETAERLRPYETLAGVYDTSREIAPEDVVKPTSVENIDIVAANDSLEPFNLPEGAKQGELQYAIRELLDVVGQDYQLVFIDTAPQIGVLPVWSALMASDFVLSPVQPEKNASESIHGVNSLVQRAIDSNPRLSHLGFIVNIRDMRLSLHTAVETKLRQLYGNLVFDTVVTNKKGFKEAAYEGKPITVSAPESDEAKMIEAVAVEMSERMNEKTQRRAA